MLISYSHPEPLPRHQSILVHCSLWFTALGILFSSRTFIYFPRARSDRTASLAVAMTTEKRSQHIPCCLARGFPGNSYTNPGKTSGKDLRSTHGHIKKGIDSSWNYCMTCSLTGTTDNIKNMTTSSLPVLDPSDPRLKLTVENRIRNIFVTQSADTRHRKEEHVNHIPVVTEPSGRVLEAGVNTLQKTLVLKKQAELEEVDEQLTFKRQEFKSCVETLSQKRTELEIKQQQTKERATKFEKFVAENEVKRRRALKKYEAAREQNISKQREIEDLREQLGQLRARQQVLKERMAKYRIYEEYLMKTLDYLPSTHLDNGSESLVMPIIRRHETLSITHQDLLQHLGRLEEAVEQSQRQIQTMTQEHSLKKLMANKELSELQNELETLKEKNKQAEVNLLMEQGLSREKVEEVGSLLMAINNLAEQCYLKSYGPLENMNILTMMDMVKESILDKADTERRARRLMESGSAMTSRTALTDRRERGSMKSIGSKTQIKSSSKVSKKSETTS